MKEDRLIKLEEQVVRLFKKYANIPAEQISELAKSVQTKAAKIQKYRCIQNYKFLSPRITSHPAFTELDFKGKYIMDIGCFFGTDLRYLTLEGSSPELIFGMDLVPEFIEMGFYLFKDRDTSDINYIVGNLLDSNDYHQIHPHKKKGSWKDLPKFSIIHAGSVLHLLEPSQVMQFTQAVSDLLLPGGIFFGRLVFSDGSKEKLEGHLKYTPTKKMFESMMLKAGFKSIEVHKMPGESIELPSDRRHFPPMGFLAKK